MTLDRRELLGFHADLVRTPSVSGAERAIADLAAGYLEARGARVERIGDSLLALAGSGPLLLFDSHLDTVPPAPGWQREPFAATCAAGRVYGLGANDAKAAVAAMTAAFLELAPAPPGLTLGLALVAQEETKSQGTRDVLDHLAARGLSIAGAVFGEPTGLDLAVAQKGLVVLELLGARRGGACRPRARSRRYERGVAFGARSGGARGPRARTRARRARRDDARTDSVARRRRAQRRTGRGERHPRRARDAAGDPGDPRRQGARGGRGGGEGALRPLRAAPDAARLGARSRRRARRARRRGRYGSSTLSDWALLPASTAGIKVGPGRSERSHTPDEFVLESEIVDGARFYVALARAFARSSSGQRAGAA